MSVIYSGIGQLKTALSDSNEIRSMLSTVNCLSSYVAVPQSLQILHSALVVTDS